MKKTLAVILAIVMSLTLFSSFAFAETTEYDLTGCKPLKIVMPLPNGTTAVDTVYTEKAMEAITERSGGLITFDYSNSGALGSAMELMEGVEMGAYNMSVIDLANFANYVPQVNALCLPYVIKDWDHAAAVYMGEPNVKLGEMIKEQMDVDILGTIGMGFRSVITKDPLYTIDDCKGYLIRIPDVQLYHDALGMLGFSCTALAFGETYSGIQTGVINGMETTLNVLYDGGYYDVAKYILQTRHFFAMSEVIVNGTWWATLPDVYKAIITDAFKEIELAAWDYARTTEEAMVPKFEEKGVEVNELSDADHAKILEIFGDYWKTAAEGMGEGAVELLNSAIELQ